MTRVAVPAGGRRATDGLRTALDRLYAEFDRADSAVDPIDRVRRFADPADREVVGFCASGLAFGRVAGVLHSIDRLLAVMGPAPADYVRRLDPVRTRRELEGFVHRWTRADDVVALLVVLGRMVRRSGSIERFFLEGDDPTAPDVGPGLESFSRRALSLSEASGDARPAATDRPGVSRFFSRPSDGSACKRLNLFLRWMVRSDAVDFGIWRGVAPSRLVVPLDVHVIRVGQCLSLTRYRSPGWRMAADITASLRRLDPHDPVRYDFALCHQGMRGPCPGDRRACDLACPLRRWCGSGRGAGP